jgi:hypothetical protein
MWKYLLNQGNYTLLAWEKRLNFRFIPLILKNIEFLDALCMGYMIDMKERAFL